MAKQATDTFVATLPDGTEQFVKKGQVLPDAHVAVKHAPKLFVDFDTQETKPSRRKAAS